MAVVLAALALLLLPVFVRRHLEALRAWAAYGPPPLARHAQAPSDREMALVRGAIYEAGTEQSEVNNLMLAFGVKRADVFAAEVPRHTVALEDFYLDRHEVTNEQFKRFIEANPTWGKSRVPARYHNGRYLQHWTGDTYPAGKARHPVVNVSWYAAAAFCRWAGKRLPTEAEWEYAARGGLMGRQFPWGDELPDRTRANYSVSGFGEAVAVGTYAPNGYGLYDMAGNVWEYMADEWGPYPARADTRAKTAGDAEPNLDAVRTRRVIRGGSWGGAPVNLRAAYRDSHPPDGAGDHVGFRCARSARRARSTWRNRP
jgi:formylglycine-generating enzyme required for sulfatase activity